MSTLYMNNKNSKSQILSKPFFSENINLTKWLISKNIYREIRCKN